MKLKLDIDPDIVAMMAAEVAAGERAVSAAIREAGTGLKAAWRAQITGAGLGARLARTIRSEAYPKGRPSLPEVPAHWKILKLKRFSRMKSGDSITAESIDETGT